MTRAGCISKGWVETQDMCLVQGRVAGSYMDEEILNVPNLWVHSSRCAWPGSGWTKGKPGRQQWMPEAFLDAPTHDFAGLVFEMSHLSGDAGQENNTALL